MSQQSEEIIFNQQTSKTDSYLALLPFQICKSCIVKAVSVGAIYFTGYFNVHPVFLIGYFLWLVIRNQQRLNKRFQQQVSMAISLRGDQQMIFANIKHPPSWIYFHDMECCEWLNKIISHIWPSVSNFVNDFVIKHIEPAINQALSEYKKNMNFKFTDANLGNITPRVCSIKVKNKTSKYYQEIVIDLNICYLGDAMFSFTLLGIGGGIYDFEMSGHIRVILKMCSGYKQPFGAIELFFLDQPKIDFALSGVLDVLGIPGLSGLLRRTVEDMISKHIVKPNKIILKLNNIVETGQWKCPDPEGFLRVNVIEARDLTGTVSGFFSKSLPDPYVEVTFGMTITSQVIDSSTNPEWNFWADFIVESFFDETVSIVVKDKTDNKVLGKVSLELSLVKEKRKIESWVQLVDVEKGLVHLGFYYYQLSSDPSEFSIKTRSYILVVFLNSIENITTGGNKTLNAIAHLTVGEATKLSKSVSAENPKFEEVFSFLVKNPDSEKLEVKLNDKTTNKELGSLDVTLQNLLKENNMEVFDLKQPLSKTDEKVSLTLKLRTLQNF